MCNYDRHRLVVQRVHLHFLSFEVEYNKKGCYYDYLNVYDGDTISAPRLAKLCGDKRPEDILSSNNSLLLVFITDKTKTFGGFVIVYKEIHTPGT
ncbi:hypothetical protein NP493_1426g00021 [Ridgeia piscesae]|uniref:CUB domain-containing protein n=1 Tax=Ridgeia piscesae TaxID=27915 RepID=A0AAD9NBS6_RIDPI|nr:hypothetical protein NP493_1426g00021 [Ridgeia piscesae]